MLFKIEFIYGWKIVSFKSEENKILFIFFYFKYEILHFKYINIVYKLLSLNTLKYMKD